MQWRNGAVREMFANRAVARATIVGVYFDVYVCSSATAAGDGGA